MAWSDYVGSGGYGSQFSTGAVAGGGSTNPAPGVAANFGGIGASLTGSGDAGGDIQVQLTGVIALVILAIVVVAAHKLM